MLVNLNKCPCWFESLAIKCVLYQRYNLCYLRITTLKTSFYSFIILFTDSLVFKNQFANLALDFFKKRSLHKLVLQVNIKCYITCKKNLGRVKQAGQRNFYSYF